MIYFIWRVPGFYYSLEIPFYSSENVIMLEEVRERVTENSR
jgi:hypothetical protein